MKLDIDGDPANGYTIRFISEKPGEPGEQIRASYSFRHENTFREFLSKTIKKYGLEEYVLPPKS